MLWNSNYQPTKIIFGENKIDLLETLIPISEKAFIIGPIVCDAIIPLFNRIEKNISNKISFKTFYEVESNPSINTVNSALRAIRKFDPDIIIGIGGVCTRCFKNLLYSL